MTTRTGGWMGSKTFRAVSTRSVAAAGLLVGALMALPAPARAQIRSIVFYVAAAPIGSDRALTGHGVNDCTSRSQPCASIAHAIAEEGALASKSTGTADQEVISLARGIYDGGGDTMFRNLDTDNDNVTITGVGPATEIDPMSCSALAPTSNGPDASSTSTSESAIVNLDGLRGITLEDMALDGSGLNGAGCAHDAGYEAAILATGAATDNTVKDVSITAATTYGIQMDDGSQTQVEGDLLQPSICATTLKSPAAGLSSGWKYDQDLTVSRIPRCASGFKDVAIAGISYAAKASGTKTIVLTGGPTSPDTPAISRHATIVFDTSVASYTGVGIACNTLVEPLPAPTSCSVSATTVIAGGTVYTTAQSPVGVLVTNAATAHLSDDKVTGNEDASGNGVGIGLLPDTVDGETAGNTTIGNDGSTGSGETLSANDVSVLGSAFPSPDSSANWNISGDTVSADNVGILLTGLTTGTNIGGVSVSANTVMGTVPGVGIELADVTAAGGESVSVGGDLPSFGNSVSGNGIGIALTEGTSNVTLENNTVDDNVFFGLAVDGQDAMPEFLPGLTAGDNTMMENTWDGNGDPVPGEINGGANVIDFGGFSFSTQSIGGSVEAQANDLTLIDPIPAGAIPTSITLSKSSGSVEVGPGTLVSIDGYCAASTFTCNGTNVSFFVTSVVNSPPTPGDPVGVIGTTPVVVDIAPIAPAAAQPVEMVGAGAAVTTNGEVPLTTSNVYSGNSCTPTAPNVSTTLMEGTGGGPSGAEGSQTGYDAC